MAAEKWKRLGLMAIGWLCVGLGCLGAALPVMPTTPFLLLALWAFARSSRRFHHWLLSHRLLGPYITDWERDRVIPLRAKIVALMSMAASLTWAVLWSSAPWYAIALMAAFIAFGAYFILSKPSRRRPPS